MRKRLLAMLIALVMVASLLPVAALAAGDGKYDIVRLMDRNEWSEAVHARAGVEVGNVVSMQRFFIYDANHNQMNSGAASGLLTPDCYYADTYDVAVEDIQTIVVILTSDGKTISAAFDTEDFEVTGTGGVAATKHIELTLTERGKGRPSGHQVNFYAELNDESTYSLYDTVYVQNGQQIGDQMPNDPPVGSYVFLGWQTEKDGGTSVDRNTYVYSDMNVYAAKGTAGTGHAQEYHVMGSTDKRSNALAIEVADHYNSANNTDYGVESFTIEDISVNGTVSNTNPIYAENEWKDEGSYYYVYNVSMDPVEVIPEHHNDRVEVADITGITVYGKLNGSDYSQFIPVSELSITEVQNNVVVELRVREKLDGVTKELVTTSDVSAPSVEGVTIPDIWETVAVPENGSVTLMYKISVFGDAGAAYNVTDENATVVNGYSLQGTIDSSRIAVIYVTKTFTADDITNGCLTNNATVVPGDNSTLGTDDGDNDDEAIVDAEVDDDPQPEKPRDPNDTELRKLAVVLECVNEDVDHMGDPKTFNLETTICTYDIDQSGEQYICSVMPDYGKILSTYNTATKATHEYEDEGKQFVLIWNASNNAWEVAGAPSITRQVKCETPEPEQPDVYEIYVTVHNGTATFYGSEVTSHILAAENEDITITFTPNEGYTLDYATIDGNMLLIPDNGVYTLKLVDSDHTIEVFYAEDKLGGGDDGTEPDGTPDYRQVFVKYVAADGNGVVTPTFDTFNLEVDENGKVMTDDALSLSGVATPNADATFAYWTIEGLGYDGGAYSYEANLSGEDFTGYFAGQTYTFTAYFNGPVVKPEQVEYDINVEVVNGTAEFKRTNIGANSVIKVYPIEDDNKNVTITFVPEDGFVFDAAYVGNEPVDLKDNSYTFGEVTADVTIKVLFKQDSVPITPVTPMPAPGEISDLIKDSITVDCVNGEVAHADKVYGLLDGSLVNVEKTDDTSIKVTLDATVYQARYNTDTETKHSLASGQSATVTFTLKYVDSKWTLPADAGELPATIKVVCATPAAPKAPTEDELKALFDGKVFVDCVEKSWHPPYAYGLLADGYTVAGPVKGADGEYTCTVTLLASAYLAEYNDDVTDKHTLASYQGNETVALKWTGSAWTVINGELPVTFDVVCDTWVPPYIPPVAPSEPVYRPNWLNTTDHFGYIIGYEDGTIKPNASITRAEVATIFFRLLTDEARESHWTETNSYSDVAPTAWYNNAVSTLSRMGILGGYEDGTFRPNASITRAEFAKIAVSFFEYKDIAAENIFTDVAAGSWYESFVAVAAKLGLIEGYAGNVYRPNESITRAEACTIINRTLGRAPDADHLLPESEMNTWPDNRPGVWYYAQLQEATNSHEYKWSGDIEHWTAKLPERDWDALQR